MPTKIKSEAVPSAMSKLGRAVAAESGSLALLGSNAPEDNVNSSEGMPSLCRRDSGWNQSSDDDSSDDNNIFGSVEELATGNHFGDSMSEDSVKELDAVSGSFTMDSRAMAQKISSRVESLTNRARRKKFLQTKKKEKSLMDAKDASPNPKPSALSSDGDLEVICHSNLRIISLR